MAKTLDNGADSFSRHKTVDAVPYINVTPLIDVLLVLLITFMVVTPLKPKRFKALAPLPPPEKQDIRKPNPNTLVIEIDKDRKVRLINQAHQAGLDQGTTDDTGALATTLSQEFQRRRDNNIIAEGMETRTDLPLEQRVERTVFVKAPRGLNYGEVVKVIDAIKGAGGNPIGLQLEGLS